MPENVDTVSIEGFWKEYEKHVVPEEAGPAQRKDLRTCFYAGFGNCLMILNRLGDEDIHSDYAVAVLASMNIEFDAFAKSMTLQA